MCQRRNKNRPLGGVKGLHVFTGWAEAGLRGQTFGAALVEAIAFAVHFQDIDVVGQPIQQRASEALGAEGFGPFFERQVAGD